MRDGDAPSEEGAAAHAFDICFFPRFLSSIACICICRGRPAGSQCELTIKIFPDPDHVLTRPSGVLPDASAAAWRRPRHNATWPRKNGAGNFSIDIQRQECSEMRAGGILKGCVWWCGASRTAKVGKCSTLVRRDGPFLWMARCRLAAQLPLCRWPPPANGE